VPRSKILQVAVDHQTFKAVKELARQEDRTVSKVAAKLIVDQLAARVKT
jgi:hypothetical protein